MENTILFLKNIKGVKMKEEKVINYYIICNKLKNIIRSGWKCWNISKDRLESVAEHIYGVQMLAIAMKSEYNYDIDIMKVINMLAIHELGETIIGDYTPFDITKEEKIKIEHEAVHKILSNLMDGSTNENLFIEFDEGITKEAKFARQCDKLECDIQAKIYDEEGFADLKSQMNNKLLENELVEKIINENDTFSSAWIRYDMQNIKYDDNFIAICEYLINNNITNKE